MTDFENKKVYDLIEKLYDDLKEKDGAYYPSKHDDYVIETVSQKLNIPKTEVDEMYKTYSAKVAKILSQDLLTSLICQRA